MGNPLCNYEWGFSQVLAVVVLAALGWMLTALPGRRAAEPPPDRRLYSINEVADQLSVTPKHVWNLAYSGELATVKLGRRRLVTAEALDRFVAGLVEESANRPAS